MTDDSHLRLVVASSPDVEEGLARALADRGCRLVAVGDTAEGWGGGLGALYVAVREALRRPELAGARVPIVMRADVSAADVVSEEARRRVGSVLGAASLVHATSAYTASVVRDLGVPPERVQTMYPGVEAGDPAPHPGPITPLRLVSVVALDWRAGLEYVLAAVRLLLDDGLEVAYEVLGDGPDRERLLFTIHDLGLVGHVTLADAPVRRKLRSVLAQSHAYVHPSVASGIDAAALTAMALGRPVAVCGEGGMAEAMSAGGGLRVPPRVPHALADALRELVRDPDRRTKLGEAARSHVLAAHVVDREADAIVQMLRYVAGGAREHLSGRPT